jgi:AraC-like DNA-binding protein
LTCDNRRACPAGRWQAAFAVPGGAATAPRRTSAPAAPSPLLAFLGQIAQAFERPAPPPPISLRRDVERTLEPLLVSGDVGIDRIAHALGCSRQTLYRRLKAEGVTFEEVLDGLRHKLAVRYLKVERVSVKEASYRLGFSDPAAFSRAFKRWTGRAPSEMRP